jgi:HPt (histidine-containing phosphotransfer) domain-containing protein
MTLGAQKSGQRGPEIDRSVLGEWLEGDDDAIDELLAVFRDSACAEQARMSEVLTKGDLTEYANAAHRLRGAALSMGARALAETAGILFAAARAMDAGACAEGMPLLATQIRAMAAEVPLTPDRARPA